VLDNIQDALHLPTFFTLLSVFCRWPFHTVILAIIAADLTSEVRSVPCRIARSARSITSTRPLPVTQRKARETHNVPQ
jgi:hypothetical protein